MAMRHRGLMNIHRAAAIEAIRAATGAGVGILTTHVSSSPDLRWFVLSPVPATMADLLYYSIQNPCYKDWWRCHLVDMVVHMVEVLTRKVTMLQ
jgi:hypothetical protein